MYYKGGETHDRNMDRNRTLSNCHCISHLRWGSLLMFMSLCMAVNAQKRITFHVTSEQGVALQGIAIKSDYCGVAKGVKTDPKGMAVISYSSKEATCANVAVTIKSKFYENLDTIVPVNASDTVSIVRLILRDKVQKIKEVEVIAYRPIGKNNAEKSVYTIDTRGLLKTTKANKALAFLPGVVAFNDSYSLAGKSQKTRIKINGVIAGAEDLKALYAGDIEKVEVREVTKDDDERFAGEINIIKKRHEQPKIFGSISATGGMIRSLWGTFDHFAFQNKHWDITGLISYNQHSQKSYTEVFRIPSLPYSPSQKMTIQRDIRIKQQAERFSLSWYPTKRFTMTLGGYHYGYPTKSSDFINDTEGDDTHRKYKETLESYGSYANGSYSINDRNKINVKGNFLYYRDKYVYDLLPDYNYKAAMREYTGEANIESRLKLWGGSHDVTFGLRNTYRQNMSYANGRNDYSMQQIYLTDYHSYGKALSSYLILKGESDNMGPKRAFSFQPSLRLNYNMGKRGTLTASYQRKTTRPSIDYLNTDSLFQNVYNIVVGNEALRAQNSDNMSVSFRKQIKKAYLITTASYIHTSNIIDQIFVNPEDYNVSTYDNIGKCDEASLSVYLMNRLCKNRMNISISLKGFYKRYAIKPELERNTLIIPSEGWGYSATFNTSYLSTKGWMYSLSANLTPKTYELSYTHVQNPNLYVSVTKSTCNNQLDFKLSFTNSLVYFYTSHTNYHFRDMYQRTFQKSYANNITLSVTWNLGKRFQQRRGVSSVVNDDIVTKQQ